MGQPTARLSARACPEDIGEADDAASLGERPTWVLNLPLRSTFDLIYLAEQRAVHEEALDTMQGYVVNGRVDDLQAFAHHMVPVVQDHIAMLRKVRDDVAYND